MYRFIQHELSWCDFREDMLQDTASGRNIKKLNDFLNQLEKEYPDVIGRIKGSK